MLTYGELHVQDSTVRAIQTRLLEENICRMFLPKACAAWAVRLDPRCSKHVQS